MLANRAGISIAKSETGHLAPLLDADNPPAPADVRRALAVIDKTITDYVTNARLGIAA